MKKILGPHAAALLLRVGLAFVLVYAALGSLMHPFEWIGYLPAMLTTHFDADTLLKIFAVYELFLAGWLLLGVWLGYGAGLAALTFLGIIVGNPHAMIITFRDIGLLFAALALAALSCEWPATKANKHR